MCKVVIFGGTAEGRKLAEYCARRGIDAVVCVISEYGEHLLPENPFIRGIQGAMTQEEMVKLLCREKPKMVFDATHPYAREATENITAACQKQKVSCLRVLRKTVMEEALRQPSAKGAAMILAGQETGSNILTMDSAAAAVAWLNHTSGNILVTTGSKELALFTKLASYKERVYARVLPDSQVLKTCEEAGFLRSHIIAMQGPFSREMNHALLRGTKAAWLVTKESGQAGGFKEKLEAAADLQVTVIVIGRPIKEEGLSLRQAYEYLRPYGTLKPKRNICLIGIGMGGDGQWTLQAGQRLKQAEAAAGAPRLLKSIETYLYGKEVCASYKSQEILDWFEGMPDLDSLAVVYSGDTGFYSGARQMLKYLKDYGQDYDLQVLPGISSVSYLCARLQIPWQEVYLASGHGREINVVELVKQHEQVFLLLDRENSVEKLGRALTEAGYGEALISAGIRLSYPDEVIITKQARQAETIASDFPCAVLIRREGYER